MTISSIGGATHAYANLRVAHTQNKQAQHASNRLDPDNDGDTDTGNGPDLDHDQGIGKNIDVKA